ILQADLIAQQNLYGKVDGKALGKLILGFGPMGGDEEAHHPSLICMSLSHHSVPQEMILKHQGIEKLRITFVLYLYPGNGEYGNDIFPLRAAALAVLIEVIDDEILNPCPAALLLIPIDSIDPNI